MSREAIILRKELRPLLLGSSGLHSQRLSQPVSMIAGGLGGGGGPNQSTMMHSLIYLLNVYQELTGLR